MKFEYKDTLLALENVGMSFDGTEVLRNVNLIESDVFREGQTTGQIIAVVGRSGRGKSTLFKIMCGLLKPTTGRVLVADTTKEGPVAKIVNQGDIGFVDQKYTLFRHKTIYQTLQYAMRKNPQTKQEKNAIIDGYLKDWGLYDHKDKYPNELSGGQRQRQGILEQLMANKHFMIFDEPTASLDIHAIDTLKEAFNLVLKSHELNTIIFSTHQIEFAVEMADSVYVLGKENDSKYATIVKHFDTKEMGLAWTKYDQKHIALVEEVKEVIRNS